MNKSSSTMVLKIDTGISVIILDDDYYDSLERLQEQQSAPKLEIKFNTETDGRF